MILIHSKKKPKMYASIKQSYCIISMLTIFLFAIIPKAIIADIPLGDQHCGDPKCLGRYKYENIVIYYFLISLLLARIIS